MHHHQRTLHFSKCARNETPSFIPRARGIIEEGRGKRGKTATERVKQSVGSRRKALRLTIVEGKACAGHLSETAGLTLGLEQAEDVVLTDCIALLVFDVPQRRGKGEQIVPGPLTLRMMERVVSSMNSTRTWVTPPREPVCRKKFRQQFVPSLVYHPPPVFSEVGCRSYPFAQSSSSWQTLLDGCRIARTGATEDAGDLDELDGDLGGFHCEVGCGELG